MPDEVGAVVGVQVADVDGVDVEQPDRPLQRAERAGPEVEHEAEAVVLDEVARAGRLGTRGRCRARPGR
jgi:hypothetical protein